LPITQPSNRLGTKYVAFGNSLPVVCLNDPKENLEDRFKEGLDSSLSDDYCQGNREGFDLEDQEKFKK
jgi:hypothetical protein